MSTPEAARLHIFDNPEAVAVAAAEWIAHRIAETSDVFRIALSGGNTPRSLYRRLASPDYHDRIEWRRVELFWGDERFVPHNDPRSNYRMARETLLAHAPVLIDHIHPIPTEGEPDQAARKYEMLLKAIYGGESFSQSRPLFDVVLLGLGADGHTASLFPGSRALEERTHWVCAVEGKDEPRITLTYPALQSARAVVFLVDGEDKADVVARVRAGDMALPAARLKARGEVLWFVDRAAASALAEAA
ncbi:MAG TPA: 6-phosphogluconolactonase [Rhizomicrobium sp.]|jgi:6-phosphogluconolactonase